MPKTPKEACREVVKPIEPEDRDVWSKDQKTHQYYYDDSHGYEVYKPEEEDSEDDAVELS